MAVRVGLFFLLVLLATGGASAARKMAETELSLRNMLISNIDEVVWSSKDNSSDFHGSATQMKNQGQARKNQASDKVLGNERLCTLCQELASEALDYLIENRTQTEFLDVLHQTCSRMLAFKQQCITLVDYYAPIFFLEVSSLQPDAFCRKFNLCQQIAFISSKFQEDRCGICHRAVLEVLIKLKNPDTQLEIIELLLKGCDSMENHAAKCKRLVFEYGPLIFENAEHLLETSDVCTVLRACDSAIELVVKQQGQW